MAKKKISDLKFDDKNFNKGTKYGKELMGKSLGKFGAGRSILIDKNNRIIAGNKTTENFAELGFDKVQIVETDGETLIAVRRNDIDLDTPEGREFALADNQTAKTNIDFDFGNLESELEEDTLEEWGVISEQEVEPKEEHAKLTDTFIVPPFSILDTKQGYWKERKSIWHNLINDRGESREKTLSSSELMSDINNGVSLLDPVLAEIANRWFALEECNTFDCFAGDSVFGYVSDSLGNNFTGIELRKEQADLNNKRLANSKSKYICDDGQNVLKHIKEDSQDFLFSCPPYYDLEVYSDMENDASNQDSYEDFLNIIRNAFTDSIKCLKNNRFAFIVVGDIRNKKGAYINFPNDIKQIFFDNDMVLYNEMILAESLGTLPQRVGRYMNNRTIGKCHQNVLVFYKGDTKEIKNVFNKIEVYAGEDV